MCSRSFNQKNNLTTHLRTHSNQNDLSSSSCHMTFSNFNGLLNHSKNHKELKPAICSYCNIVFNDVSSLSDHMKQHSNQKPYKCDVSNVLFINLVFFILNPKKKKFYVCIIEFYSLKVNLNTSQEATAIIIWPDRFTSIHEVENVCKHFNKRTAATLEKSKSLFSTSFFFVLLWDFFYKIIHKNIIKLF